MRLKGACFIYFLAIIISNSIKGRLGMFLKVSDIINLPVINLTSGQQVAIVKNLVLDASKDSVLGVICGENKFLPWEKIVSLGQDAVMVETETDDLDELWEELKLPLEAPLFLPEQMLGVPVITKSGKTIGSLGEIIINNETGLIQDYEVSDGLIKDLVAGRNTISINQIVTYGEDTIVINEV